MQNTKIPASAIAAALLLAGCTAANNAEYPGYVTDSRGQLLLNRDGRCWRNADWRPHLALAECDPALASPVPVAEAEPAPETKPAPEPAPQPFAPASITLPFASAQYRLNSDTLNALENFWAQLPREKRRQLQFRVEGHADPMGGAEENRQLSARRAQSVSDWLRQRGVDETTITPTALGGSQASSHCPATLPRAERIACLAPDRRVTITAMGNSED